MNNKEKKGTKIDPATLARIREEVRSAPVRGSRSLLAPLEDNLLELRAKGHTYQFISDFLAEHIQWAPAGSTLHAFVKAAKKRRAKARLAKTFELAPVMQPPSATTPVQPQTEPTKNAVRAAIQALKAQAATKDAKPKAKAFTFKPEQPLISQPKQT